MPKLGNVGALVQEGINGVLASLSGHLSTSTFVEGDLRAEGRSLCRPDLVGILLPAHHTPDSFSGTSRPSSSMHAGRGGNCLGTQHFGNLGRNALVGTSLSKLWYFQRIKNIAY